MENNPYAPPASSMQGAPELVRVTEASDFRDLSGISGKLSMLLLVAWAIVRRVGRDQSETYAQMNGAPAQ
jgi:hypothetical protein